jgi:hypothetical protein
MMRVSRFAWAANDTIVGTEPTHAMHDGPRAQRLQNAEQCSHSLPVRRLQSHTIARETVPMRHWPARR